MARPLMPAMSSGALPVISPTTLIDWLTGSTLPPIARDLRGIVLPGLVDMQGERVTGLQPAQPTGRRDQLDLEAAVIEDIEQRLAGAGVLKFTRLLLDRDAVEGGVDRAFRSHRIGAREIGLRLLHLRGGNIELQLPDGFERQQALVDAICFFRLDGDGLRMGDLRALNDAIEGDQIFALLEMLAELGADPIDAPGELARQGGVLARRELRADLGAHFRGGPNAIRHLVSTVAAIVAEAPQVTRAMTVERRRPETK